MNQQLTATTPLHCLAPLLGRVKSLAVLAVAGAALASCRDTTAPFAVVISATPMAPTYGTDTDGRPWLTCHVSLDAATAGSGRAEWEDAVLYFFAANNRSTILDSSVISAATVQSSWGATLIGETGPQHSGWTLTAAIPFAVTIEYRYQVVGGQMASSRVSATCAPAVPSGPAPVFTTLAIGSSSVVQPGGTLVLDYTVTSTVGLWATILSLSGPCDTSLIVGEPLLPSDTRTVNYALPNGCSLGVPLTVTVTALDAALQSTSMTTTLPGMVDTISPTVEVLIGPRFGGSYTDVLAGDYFVGDSMLIMFIANDNNVVRSLIWEVDPQGFRDSVMVNAAGGLVDYLAIPVRPSWAGPIQMRFYARDASGNTSQVIQSAPGAINVIPTVSLSASQATVSFPFGGVAWDMRRGQLYLNQGDWKKIGVFSRAANAVISTIQLSDYPGSFDLTPGGDSLIVAQVVTRSLAVVDLRASPPTVTEVPLPGVDTTMTLVSLVSASNGKVLVTANNYAAGTGHLYAYDLGTRTLQLRTDAGIAGQTGGGAMVGSSDHAVAVLNGGPGMFQRYDAATDAFRPATTARGEGTLAVDATGSHVTVGGDIYDSTLQYVVTPRVFHYRYQPIVLSADGKVIYFSYGNAGNVRCRTSDGSTIDRLQYRLTVNGLSMSPDGSTLAVTDEGTPNVTTLGFVTVPALTGGAPVAHPARAFSAVSPREDTKVSPPRGSAESARHVGAQWQAATVDLGRKTREPATAAERLLAHRTLRLVPRVGP